MRSLLFTALALAIFLVAGPAALHSEDLNLRITSRREVYSLIGDWRFKTGDMMEYRERDFDDKSWERMFLPQNWHRTGLNFDGVAWYRTQFYVSEDFRDTVLAIVLPLREGWHELYINGVRMDQGASLEMTAPNAFATRGVMIAIPSQYLVYNQQNSIAIRMKSYGGVGGFITRTMFMGDIFKVERRYSLKLMWNMVLVTLFVLNGLTHFVTFLTRRGEIHYLYFAIFSIAIGFIVASLDNLTQFLWNSFYFQHLSVHIPLVMAPILLVEFSYSFFGMRGNRATSAFRWLGLAFAACVAFSCTGGPGYGVYIRYILPILLAFCFIAISYCLMLTIMSIRSRIFTARIVGFGFLIFAISSVNDILSYLQIIHTTNVLDEGFLCFVISMSVSLSLKFSRLQSDISALNTKLHNNLRALQSARNSASESEARYRDLVESSNEIIFALDSSGLILMMNQAVGQHLGIPSQDLVGQEFLAMIYHSGESRNSLARHTVRQKLRELIESKSEVVFRTDFFTRTREPRELLVKLQYIPNKQGYTIAGTAAVEQEDELLALCTAERQVYVFGNYVYLADSISQRLFAGLAKYLDHDAAYSLKVCIREMIINAIEHGNLGISFDEKTEAQNEGTYFSLLISRQTDAVYSNRQVTLVYSLTSRRAVFRITDQGDGFDHAEIMGRDIRRPEYFHLMHGRGIAMARIEFDTVKFNKKGNSVVLIKRFVDSVARSPQPASNLNQ
ncbi:MAG: ATP-binding protein [Leptospirales bacterium]|nr:ATP-binding protein [Leptospirales bacterium]